MSSNELTFKIQTKHQLEQPSNQERKTVGNKINKNLNFFKNLEKEKNIKENKKIVAKPEDKNQTYTNQTRIDKFLLPVKETPPKPEKNPPNTDLEVKTVETKLELKTKHETNPPTPPKPKPSPKTKPKPLSFTNTLKKQEKIAQKGSLQEKIRK